MSGFWYLIAVLWAGNGVLLATHLVERRTPDQRQVDALAKRARGRR